MVPRKSQSLLLPRELKWEEETPGWFAAWETLPKPEADSIWLIGMAPGLKERSQMAPLWLHVVHDTSSASRKKKEEKKNQETLS